MLAAQAQAQAVGASTPTTSSPASAASPSTSSSTQSSTTSTTTTATSVSQTISSEYPGFLRPCSRGELVVGMLLWGITVAKTWDPAGSCFILRSSMSLNCSISYRRTLHANLFSFFHYLKELLQESGARSACSPPSLGLCVFFFCCDHIISKLFRIPLLFTVDNSVLEAFPRKS